VSARATPTIVPREVARLDPKRLDDEALLAAFEAAAFAPGSFHHRHHVRVVWAYLERRDVLDVLARFSAGLRALAAAAGKPGLYHETITWAFVLLVNERAEAEKGHAHGNENGRRDEHDHEDWNGFAQRNHDLLAWKPSVLEQRYYKEDTLWSDRARARFVMPDRGITA